MRSIKLKGGALYIAIIVSLLISIILGLFIVLANYNSRNTLNTMSLVQLQHSLNSGFELSRSSYYANNYQWTKLPYNEDSVIIQKSLWGNFERITVRAKNKHHALVKSGLFGVSATPDTALIIADNARQIGLSGEVKFTGFAYLPKSGIKPAYIGGKSFSDVNAIKPFLRQSPSVIPAINQNYLAALKVVQTEVNVYSDSLVAIMQPVTTHSFDAKTLVYEQAVMALSDVNWQGNIKIIAKDVITIDSSCVLNDVFLIARKIKFKKGFKGTVHAMATDSIVAEDRCDFNYPSSFTVLPGQTQSSVHKVIGVFFGEASVFKGAILVYKHNDDKLKTMIRFTDKFQFIGSAYSTDYINMMGNLYGTLIAGNALVQNTSSVYENHLMDCVIDSKKYGHILTVPSWFNQTNTGLKCAKYF